MKTVLVPLADGCEELEAISITDILTRAGVKVVTAGLKSGLVTASRGIRIMPDVTLDSVQNEHYDMIILPGGLPGADNLAADSRIIKMIQTQNKQSKFIAAICAAPKVFAVAKVIDDRQITHYPNALNDIPTNWQYSNKAIVTDGHIITGRGPGVAMDFALELAEILVGKEKRNDVEKALVR